MFILTFTEMGLNGVEQVHRIKATRIRKNYSMLIVDRLTHTDGDGVVESFYFPTSNVQVRSMSEVWSCE